MDILVSGLEGLGFFFLVVILYFFIVTRLAVAVKAFFQKPGKQRDSLYWLYTNKYLIKITDNQLVTSAVLLFQYNRLARRVVDQIGGNEKGSKVLQISCAYGNFSRKLAEKCRAIEAGEMVICDIVGNQLENVKRKIRDYPGKATLVEENAANMRFKTDHFSSALIFFLLHELPFEDKQKALSEAMRVVRPGGRLVLAEFHKPRNWLMRAFVRAYFIMFEPFALDMWGRLDPIDFIRQDKNNAWTIEKESYLCDNFQVITAIKALS